MQKKLLLLVVLLPALIFTSCDKDKDKPNPGETIKLLKKTIQTEATGETVYHLNYDDSKRLVSIKNADNTESQTFTYDAAGKVTGTVSEGEDFKEVLSFTYTNGIPVSGIYKSFIKYPSQPDQLENEVRMIYTVVNNQVTTIYANYVSQGTAAYLYLFYTNGNLAKVKMNRDYGVYEATFSYGNKKSAFPKVFDFIMDLSGHSLRFGSNNELHIADYDYEGTRTDATVTTQYTYDADGHVLSSDDGDVQTKFEYE